jgi:hypothetical protein
MRNIPTIKELRTIANLFHDRIYDRLTENEKAVVHLLAKYDLVYYTTNLVVTKVQSYQQMPDDEKLVRKIADMGWQLS